MSTMTEFRRWYSRNVARTHNVQHFEAHELIILSTRRGVTNTVPPPELWLNCIEPICILDELRAKLGWPLNITSGYRSLAYNRAVGGVANSQHVRFCAFDVTSNYVTPRVLYQRLLKLRKDGRFKGGLGLYRTFVHIDTRGRSATWQS